jgi:hypothetical protein
MTATNTLAYYDTELQHFDSLVTYKLSPKASVFVSCKPFQPSLKFASKARNLLKGVEPENRFTWVGS